MGIVNKNLKFNHLIEVRYKPLMTNLVTHKTTMRIRFRASCPTIFASNCRFHEKTASKTDQHDHSKKPNAFFSHRLKTIIILYQCQFVILRSTVNHLDYKPSCCLCTLSAYILIDEAATGRTFPDSPLS